MKTQFIHGIHAVKSALKYDPTTIQEIMVDKRRSDDKSNAIIGAAKKAGVTVSRRDKKELDKLADGENHQGVIAVSAGSKPKGDKELTDFIQQMEHNPFLLILDGVQDPHNLGACLRTANAAGVDAVIIPKDKAVGMTSVVHKVSCGASHVIPVFQITNLSRTMKSLQKEGVWIIGTAGETDQSYLDIDFKGSVAVVMGAEGDGMRRLTKEACDYLVKIPMEGVVESLNVSVATGVVLFEAKRQRQ